MFRKVLIANRGEIAVRVIRTLREMGIGSVAVYSEADRNALHVRLADEAYPVGPTPSSESYLVVENIIRACKESGAEAVHPGYGFLSENAEFVAACQKENITFIGPDPSAMKDMGSKTAAREKMIAAGVPVVPGHHADTIAELKKAAKKLGYPVMLKASAGGGGKGMRLVDKPEDLASAWERARGEAKNAFGDETVYVEKAIIQPRHVEIQVLADKKGNTVHLFERDCSIQRRHQKVVEEAPSPASVLTEKIVDEMGAVAVKAAQAVGYHSAGTIEFLLAQDGSFYFLEMNTRLQVEHPITEWITSIDLVREQVRIAYGEELGYTQKDIQKKGHAIECRIYAEDPKTGFLPSPGTITTLRTPSGPGVRDDSGVYQGSEITSFYDPLVSKLSVWAPTRERAIEKMRSALFEYTVGGIRTNIPFHIRLMNHEEFVAGNFDTGFIEKYKDTLLYAPNSTENISALAIGGAIAQALQDRAAAEQGASTPRATAAPTSQPSAWRASALPKFG